eukprot:9067319-Pyramimonas_sp.AAC.1
MVQDMCTREQAQLYVQNTLQRVTGRSRHWLQQFEVGQAAPGSVRGVFLDWPFEHEAYSGALAPSLAGWRVGLQSLLICFVVNDARAMSRQTLR